ncbi:hypothetical protein WJX73_000022 [Symbiochloris irregularis]|uniref:Nudix hydrolase domain-containing protein n=1 Tax=Symbiochloris irregularis TaxID=706552 RepID=A0AAW1PBG1_9CHLO
MSRILFATSRQALKSRVARTMSKAFATQDFYRHGLRSLSAENNASGTMEKAMQRLGSVALQDMPGPSNFVKTQSVMYDMDGKQRRWDVVQSHSSVGVVVFHTELQALVLVRQFRPAVYATHLRDAQAHSRPDPPLSVGFCHELCAGIIDKEKSLEEIAHEEVLEETGYNAPAQSMQPVVTYISAVGTGGSTHHMFACQVDEGMRNSGGGGLADAGEAIEI